MSFGTITGFAVTDSQKCVGDAGFISLEVDGKPKTVADVRGAVLQWIGKNKLTISADAVVRDLNSGKFIQCAGHSIKITNSSVKVDVDKAGEMLKSVGRSAYGLPKGATDADTELILWGIPKGKTDRLYEKVLYPKGKTQAAIEKVKRMAAGDGWHSFRVTTLNLADKPNFSKVLAKDSMSARVFRKRIG